MKAPGKRASARSDLTAKRCRN